MNLPSLAPSTPHDLALQAARLTLTKRAEDVLILDLRRLDGVCDYFVLATGHLPDLAECVIPEPGRTIATLAFHRQDRQVLGAIA